MSETEGYKAEDLALSCEIGQGLIINREWVEVQPNGLQVDVQQWNSRMVATLWDAEGSDEITSLRCDLKGAGSAVVALRQFAKEQGEAK